MVWIILNVCSIVWSCWIFVVFVLVEVDGCLLVDGGMVNNVLIDVVW